MFEVACMTWRFLSLGTCRHRGAAVSLSSSSKLCWLQAPWGSRGHSCFFTSIGLPGGEAAAAVCLGAWIWVDELQQCLCWGPCLGLWLCQLSCSAEGRIVAVWPVPPAPPYQTSSSRDTLHLKTQIPWKPNCFLISVGISACSFVCGCFFFFCVVFL